MIHLPYITAYDPPGSSESKLDPLGLYLIADQLATRLVPAVRERMQRIRFLTPITVGALITEDLEPNPRHPNALPYLVWEWLVVEAIVRACYDEKIWGLPGSMVTKNAVDDYGYLDERSYLKTPRIFGFHGVYKRIAIHLGFIDTHLRFRAPRGEELVSRWARGCGLGRFDVRHPLYQKWRKAVEVSLRESPVRTRTTPRWKKEDWQELANVFVPHKFNRIEKRYLTQLLKSTEEDRLGALIPIWNLLSNSNGQVQDEHIFHRQLRCKAPEYTVVLDAIETYESFCRNLSDAFDIMRAKGSHKNHQSFNLTSLHNDPEFCTLAKQSYLLHHNALAQLSELDPTLEARFMNRFDKFYEPMPPEHFALAICEHHETVQQAKSREGKRCWFERLGPECFHIRQNYRVERPVLLPGKYLHEYRTIPISRFYRDLK